MNTNVTNRELAAGEGSVWCRECAFGLRPIRPDPEGKHKMFGLRKQETEAIGIEIAKSRISNCLTALFHGFWAKKGGGGQQVRKISTWIRTLREIGDEMDCKHYNGKPIYYGGIRRV